MKRSIFHTIQQQDSERGVILILFAICLPVVLIFAALTIDLGRSLTLESGLQSAVDASALAAARHVRSADDVSEDTARDIFLTNFQQFGIRSFGDNTQALLDSLSVVIHPINAGNPNIWATISVNGDMPTAFAKVALGTPKLNISVTGTAVRANAIISIALDNSFSIIRNGATDDLVSGVQDFVSHFNEDSDRIGIVRYHHVSSELTPLDRNFAIPIADALTALDGNLSAYQGWTSMDEALALSQSQIEAAPVALNERVKRIIVFFTDGLANAFKTRMNCNIPGLTTGLQEIDIIVARNFDLYNPTNGQPAGRLYFSDLQVPPQGGCAIDPSPACTSGSHPFPFDPLRGCVADVNYGCTLQAEAERRTILEATAARDADTIIFAIGLGSSASLDACGKPAINPTFLDSLSGSTGSNFAVASDSSELSGLFNEIASHILVQLTK